MDKELIKDIIGWDVVNWSKAIDFWENQVDIHQMNLTCLELGGNKGGLSLWLAINGNNVICSDLVSPEKEASKVHQKYDYNGRISYQSVDATNIPFENHFDIIVFKSILGGISRDNRDDLKKKTIDEIYKALKPSGRLLFAENLEATLFHKFMRRRFLRWGSEWNYLHLDEINTLFSSFKNMKYMTTGFWGTFGRNEYQRYLLGKFDRVFEKIIPGQLRYILIAQAEK